MNMANYSVGSDSYTCQDKSKTCSGSGDKLKKAVRKIIEHSLSNINESIVKRTATESIARAALQTPQDQPAQPVYTNGTGYEQYTETNSARPDPTLSSANTYTVSQPTASFAYNNGSAAPVAQPQQFDQQAYNGGEDAGMTPSHAAALAAAASAAPGSRHGSYSYSNSQATSNVYQQQYPTIGVSPADWHQWSRTNLQQLPTGEYLNSANTLLTLGAREGGTGPSHDAVSAVEGPPIQTAVGISNYQWPVVMFGAGSTGHVGQQ